MSRVEVEVVTICRTLVVGRDAATATHPRIGTRPANDDKRGQLRRDTPYDGRADEATSGNSGVIHILLRTEGDPDPRFVCCDRTGL